jgi:hypothetical protein
MVIGASELICLAASVQRCRDDAATLLYAPGCVRDTAFAVTW